MSEELEEQGYYLQQAPFVTRVRRFVGSLQHKRANYFYKKRRPYRLEDTWQATGFYRASQSEVDARWLDKGVRVCVSQDAAQQQNSGLGPAFEPGDKGTIVEADSLDETGNRKGVLTPYLNFGGEVKVQFDQARVTLKSRDGVTVTGKVTHEFAVAVAISGTGTVEDGKTGKLKDSNAIGTTEANRSFDPAKEYAIIMDDSKRRTNESEGTREHEERKIRGCWLQQIPVCLRQGVVGGELKQHCRYRVRMDTGYALQSGLSDVHQDFWGSELTLQPAKTVVMDASMLDSETQPQLQRYRWWACNHAAFSEFGIGVASYFNQLLAVFALDASIKGCASSFYSSSLQSISGRMAAFPAVNLTSGYTKLLGQGAEDLTLAFAVPDLVVTFTLLVFLAFANRSQDKIVKVIDEAQQTAQDYSIQVNNPPTDNPKFYEHFFETHWGTVINVTVVRANRALLRALVAKRQMQQRLDVAIRQAQVPASSEKDAAALKKMESQLQVAEEKVADLMKVDEYPVVKVFVTFNRQEDQLRCLSDLRAGWLETRYRNSRIGRLVATALCLGNLGLRSPKRFFVTKERCITGNGAESDWKYTHVGLDVTEPCEPSELIWPNLEIKFWPTRIKGELATMCVLTLLIFVSWLIQTNMAGLPLLGLFGHVERQQHESQGLTAEPWWPQFEGGGKKDQFEGLYIAAFNMALPNILIALNPLEIHHDDNGYARSLLVQLALARFVNSAILPFITTAPFNMMKPATLTRIQAILISDALFAPVLRMLDLFNIFKHFIGVPLILPGGPSAKTQRQTNEIFSGSWWSLAERYTGLLNSVFVALFYSSILPVVSVIAVSVTATGVFISCGAMLINYLVDKWLLVHRWQKKPLLDSQLNKVFLFWFIIVVWGHLLLTNYIFAGWPFEGTMAAQDSDGNPFLPLPAVTPLTGEYLCCLKRPHLTHLFFEDRLFYRPCQLNSGSCWPKCRQPAWTDAWSCPDQPMPSDQRSLVLIYNLLLVVVSALLAFIVFALACRYVYQSYVSGRAKHGDYNEGQAGNAGSGADSVVAADVQYDITNNTPPPAVPATVRLTQHRKSVGVDPWLDYCLPPYIKVKGVRGYAPCIRSSGFLKPFLAANLDGMCKTQKEAMFGDFGSLSDEEIAEIDLTKDEQVLHAEAETPGKRDRLFGSLTYFPPEWQEILAAHRTDVKLVQAAEADPEDATAQARVDSDTILYDIIAAHNASTIGMLDIPQSPEPAYAIAALSSPPHWSPRPSMSSAKTFTAPTTTPRPGEVEFVGYGVDEV